MNNLPLPPGWKLPKYVFGDRAKQGLIIGLCAYPADSYPGRVYGTEWKYTVLPDKAEEELEYFSESELRPLSREELKAEIETEIRQHMEALDALNCELARVKSDRSLKAQAGLAPTLVE